MKDIDYKLRANVSMNKEDEICESVDATLANNKKYIHKIIK